MHSDRLSGSDVERAALRLRLAAAALATTLILLGGDAPAAVPLVLLGYVLVAVAARFGTPLLTGAPAGVAVIGAMGLDIAATAGLVAALPIDRPAWMLFLFPIGHGALRFGPLGAAAAAAIAIVLVDVTIALRLSEAEAIQLWPLQLLVAAALVAAELARLRERDEREHDMLRRRAAAREDLSAGVASAHVLRSATEHLSRLPGVTAAWAWVQKDDGILVEHERGDLPAPLREVTSRAAEMPSRGRVVASEHVVPSLLEGRVIGLHDDPYTAVGVILDPAGTDAERRDALMLDIADASARALAAAVERERAERAVGELRVALESVRGQLRAKEEAVATAVHELRTPLTSVGGYAQIVSRHLDTMQRQVAQLARLISDLQPAAARSAELTVAPLDLRDLVRGAVSRVRVLSDANVELDEPRAPIVLTVDGPRIGQVIDNLLGNAVKYSPAPARIAVGLREEDDSVLLTVTDQGRGISAEDLPRLFERGYRAADDVRGQGLGLAVVREVVEAHGGRVGASSPGEGAGSTFWMVLPRAARPAIPDGNGERPPAADEGEADRVPREPAG
ncbi:MAG: sensor histidine kinase [Candidatus Limnocylindria bacterium]